MQEKYGFVYIWFDRKHKRYYIGMHWGTEDDGYVCSSNWMRDAYKRRTTDFKRKILERVYTNRNDLYHREKYWLSLIKENELKVRYYNLSKNVNDTWLNEENIISRKEKISIRTKEAMQRPEIREKYLNSLTTRDTKSSDIEVREKRRNSMIGKNVGKDVSKAVKISAEMRRGVKLSEQHKQKIKNAGTFSLINNKKVSCIHCGFIGNPGNIGRYHNDRCKRK
jgi:hypothetical protein